MKISVKALTLFFCAAVSLVLLLAYLYSSTTVFQTVQHFDEDRSRLPWSIQIYSSIRPVIGSFEKAINEKRIVYDDFEKLDFTFPEDSGFNASSDYSVFNRNGKIGAYTALGRLIKKRMPAYSDRITFSLLRSEEPVKHPAFVGNFQKDSIVLIVSDFDQSQCAPQSIRTMAEKFPSLVNNQKIIEMDFSIVEVGCVEDIDNKYYYLVPIVSRFKNVSTSETFLTIR